MNDLCRIPVHRMGNLELLTPRLVCHKSTQIALIQSIFLCLHDIVFLNRNPKCKNIQIYFNKLPSILKTHHTLITVFLVPVSSLVPVLSLCRFYPFLLLELVWMMFSFWHMPLVKLAKTREFRSR